MTPGLEGSVRRPRYRRLMASSPTAENGEDGANTSLDSVGGKKDEFEETEGELVDKEHISGVAWSEIGG